jgi:hypothetical protein
MTDRHTIWISSRANWELARQGVQVLGNRLGEGWRLVLTRKRSNEQNDLMWVWLGIISKSLLWHGKLYSDHQWKDNLMHAYHGGEWMPGIDGGMVPVGRSTSKLGKSEFSAFLDMIEAFAGQNGIILQRPAAPAERDQA